MQVFKFGGASVSSASSIKNAASILRGLEGSKVVVISAMGKMTNALESLVKAYFNGVPDCKTQFEAIKKFHRDIMLHLTGGNKINWDSVDVLFEQLEQKLATQPSLNFDYEYDQIVSYGELLSTLIISTYLNASGIKNEWIDIRKCFITNDLYREAIVNWELTDEQVKSTFSFEDCSLYITQGFLGGTTTNQTTTLGREGSDYSAAILGNILDAKNVTIWKNVPGILNADPDYLPATQKLDELSYREAIELSYSGAKVIHPKTIKPLQNKNIPLLVKSFDAPEKEGTIIQEIDYKLNLPPVFIIKKKQALVTLSPYDFSFFGMETVSELLIRFAEYRLKFSLVQHSAIDLSFVFDEPERGIEPLIEELQADYDVRYNTGLELVTIRYYNQEAIDEITHGRKTYIEQKSRRTTRLVLK